MEAILVTDSQHRIQVVNPAFCEITGYREDEVIGQNPKILKSGRHDDEFYQKMYTALETDGHWQGEIWDRRKDGSLYLKWVHVSTIKDEHGQVSHNVAIFSDITERKMAEDRMQHLAHYDSLTELPNRLLFYDRLGQSIEHARRNNTLTALLLLDLDRFKLINDSLGHDVGDLLLVEVAQRLKQVLRGVDTIARLGGDEFTVILDDLQHPHDASRIARKLVNRLSTSYSIAGHECYIGVSIGISLYPSDGKDVHTLAKHADIAMYRAKDRGRNNYQEYNQSMSTKATRRLELENKLRHALRRHEFELHYQPQLDLQTGEIVAFEGLIRWNHEGKLVPPVEFIGIAEETGLIIPIGEWVMQTACEQIKNWANQGVVDKRIAVNLSAHQLLNKDFIRSVARILKYSGIDPALFELELTESAVVQYPEKTIPILQELNAMGVQLALDDFGTGYSSLSYLRQLPIHIVKIDRSFVADVIHDKQDAEIVSAIIAMGHSLNLTVIGEGVEDTEQLQFLMNRKCDLIQGYLIRPAVPADNVAELLNQGNILERYKIAPKAS